MRILGASQIPYLLPSTPIISNSTEYKYWDESSTKHLGGGGDLYRLHAILKNISFMYIYLEKNVVNSIKLPFDSTRAQTDLSVCGIDALCHNKAPL